MIALKRGMFAAGVLLICAWVVVPIYLIALGGLGGEQVVYAWPKPFWLMAWSGRNFTAFTFSSVFQADRTLSPGLESDPAAQST